MTQQTTPKSRTASLVADLLESHGVVVRISAQDLLDASSGLELSILRDGVSSNVQHVSVPTWVAASWFLEGLAAGACLPAKEGKPYPV